MVIEKITKNSARCLLCGDVLVSEHRHDFKSCRCGNLSVDGGNDYVRRGYYGSKDTILELSEGELLELTEAEYLALDDDESKWPKGKTVKLRKRLSDYTQIEED